MSERTITTGEAARFPRPDDMGCDPFSPLAKAHEFVGGAAECRVRGGRMLCLRYDNQDHWTSVGYFQQTDNPRWFGAHDADTFTFVLAARYTALRQIRDLLSNTEGSNDPLHAQVSAIVERAGLRVERLRPVAEERVQVSQSSMRFTCGGCEREISADEVARSGLKCPHCKISLIEDDDYSKAPPEEERAAILEELQSEQQYLEMREQIRDVLKGFIGEPLTPELFGMMGLRLREGLPEIFGGLPEIRRVEHLGAFGGFRVTIRDFGVIDVERGPEETLCRVCSPSAWCSLHYPVMRTICRGCRKELKGEYVFCHLCEQCAKPYAREDGTYWWPASVCSGCGTSISKGYSNRGLCAACAEPHLSPDYEGGSDG